MLEVLHALQQYYGYSTFKRGQEELVHSILSGQDCLAVMPTGAGKSICYQLPAALMEGIAVVVSPLLSLIKDQVDALLQIGIPATFISSSLTASEIRRRYREMAEGKYKLVYITPERLETRSFVELLQPLPISLLAVDEAHCVSQWGHDFRPSYLNISQMLNGLPKRPVVAAFTATATEQVKQDIARHLNLKQPCQVNTGFARENLSFSVLKGVNKRDFLMDYLKNANGQSGIIYASTRKEVEQTWRFLQKLGYAAGRYHAGMSDQERAEMQERFQYDELRIMVATNAFGMGIDKSNVRFVIHYNLPKNIEAYYQEAGRAGRDGEPGECVLLCAPQDTMTQKFLIEQSEADEDRRVMEYANLREMTAYCHTTECLQQYIIRYFGDHPSQSCGRCSNCRDEREYTDLTEEAQKIFSCVVRMKQRFGITLTAKVLRGANDARVKQFRFDTLPTYGVMRQFKEKQIVDLLHVFAADGYLRLSEGKYPVVSLTARAKAVLNGEEQVLQREWKLPKQPEAQIVNEELFEQLRQLRQQFAKRYNVPPFTVFHDAALRQMCERLPGSKEEMLQVKGVGSMKYERFGADFLDCITAYKAKAL